MTLVATYQWSLIWDHKVDFLNGLKVAIEVSFVAMVLSVAVGILLALARMSKPPVSWLAAGYINVFRGVPALVSVLWVYFGVSLVIGINFTVFQSGVIADVPQRIPAESTARARGDSTRPARRPCGGMSPLRCSADHPAATKNRSRTSQHVHRNGEGHLGVHVIGLRGRA